MANITVDKACCKGCNICLSVCPKNVFAKSKVRNDYGTPVPQAAHPEDCIGCRMCERLCPDGAIDVEIEPRKSAKAE